MVDFIGRPKANWWFWVIGVLALIWNLMGVGAYLMDVTASQESLVESYGQQTADAFAVQPALVTGAYALAVFSGAIGALMLLLKKRWAAPLFLLSLICVLVQQVYWWFLTDIAAIQPASQKVMTIMIVVVAIFLLLFARNMTTKGILR